MTDLSPLAQRLAQDPVWQLAAAAAASVLLHGWIFFGGTYGAHHWALKAERPKALKGAAYVAALPVRLLFALFSGIVATLVWALVLGGGWALWKALHG